MKPEYTDMRDLTCGNITGKLWIFALPLMIGNVMQQLYNLVDTWVVGKYLGEDALAAVGSSYSLMTFLTSILLGLCLGSGSFFSITFGKRDEKNLRNGIFLSFLLICAVSVLLTAAAVLLCHPIIRLLQVPDALQTMMQEYLLWIFAGIFATFLYNFYACLLRGLGNSLTPLCFLGISVILNIGLDLYFVAGLHLGIGGAAAATVLSQYVSGIGLLLYTLLTQKKLRIHREDMFWNRQNAARILSLSGLTCLQQSVMNFGILLVQGIVNSFGASVMAAFAVAVKIDTVAYMPVQDFGNAFSTFVAQNYGANKAERIRTGIRSALVSVILFCAVISSIVFVSAESLMHFFTENADPAVIIVGSEYLRIEGACYIGIGILFMLYGYYRAINRPSMSVILTIISLGTRVLLSYTLSRIPSVGETGIWVSIPIGWVLADLTGILFYQRKYRKGAENKFR